MVSVAVEGSVQYPVYSVAVEGTTKYPVDCVAAEVPPNIHAECLVLRSGYWKRSHLSMYVH